MVEILEQEGHAVEGCLNPSTADRRVESAHDGVDPWIHGVGAGLGGREEFSRADLLGAHQFRETHRVVVQILVHERSVPPGARVR